MKRRVSAVADRHDNVGQNVSGFEDKGSKKGADLPFKRPEQNFVFSTANICSPLYFYFDECIFKLKNAGVLSL